MNSSAGLVFGLIGLVLQIPVVLYAARVFTPIARRTLAFRTLAGAFILTSCLGVAAIISQPEASYPAWIGGCFLVNVLLMLVAIRIVRQIGQPEFQRAIEQKHLQLEQLQSNLADTVHTIAKIVEMRDPYTAGHQDRVAELSVAIAKQLQLSDDQIQGIYFAGILHDLGKIYIPAEMLSKPGRLSEVEYQFIQSHSQAGYEMLEGINFPWPIAQIVLQHHEKIDGSGYPQGLRGESILLEARILAIADLVEAMSSHRPYRPGLGIEAALEEMTKQRGIHYDAELVDICLRLFRELNFSFNQK